MTRKLTVDRYDGLMLKENYRNQAVKGAPEELDNTVEGTLDRQEQSRKPFRRPGSKNTSPREDLAEPVQRGHIQTGHSPYSGHPSLPGHPGPKHPLYSGPSSYQSGTGNESPVYDRISPSSSGFCSGELNFATII